MPSKKDIWEKKRPSNAKHHSMTPGQKASAARIAKKHGTKVGLADRLAAMKKSK
jgi:hypothetical protein